MGKERGAKQLIVCKKKDGVVEVKGDWDKREVVMALQQMISEEDAMKLWVLPRARKGPQTQNYQYPLQKLAVKDHKIVLCL